MWFRYILALAAIALVSFVVMMLLPQHDVAPGQTARPAVATGPGKI